MKTNISSFCDGKSALRGLLASVGLLAGLLTMAAPVAAQENSLANTNFSIASREQGAREPKGLRDAAVAGLKKMLTELGRDIEHGTLPDGFPFDVADFSELADASLGVSFEIHTVHPQTLLAGGKRLEQMVQGNGIWNFVVMVKQHPVALLEMAKINGQWQVQGAGGAKLAQDVYQAAQAHGGKTAFRFVRIYQATADFLEVQDNQTSLVGQGKPRYVPLIAARESLRMSSLAAKDSVLPGSPDVLPALQDAVRKSLAAQNNH